MENITQPYSPTDQDTLNALVNILEDFAEEKSATENTQKATLNILHDFAIEKNVSENTQKAVLNILEDFAAEKETSENTKKAVFNILEDFNEEKTKVDLINGELAAANKELESFSYSVSHDLRTPLRAINGYARILEEEYSNTFDPEAGSLLKIIQDNAIRMGKLIDDLLAFSRIGRQEIKRSNINMNQLVTNVIEELNKTTDHKATIQIHTLHRVMGDETLLTQVMMNLLSNAIKYSSKTDAPAIEISSEQKNNEVIYSVKDNGVGYDTEFADKLFGVFQRLHSLDEFEGTGVGLAIVHRVITKHGGRVWSTSETGNGAIFFFSLPLVQPLNLSTKNIFYG